MSTSTRLQEVTWGVYKKLPGGGYFRSLSTFFNRGIRTG